MIYKPLLLITSLSPKMAASIEKKAKVMQKKGYGPGVDCLGLCGQIHSVFRIEKKFSAIAL